MGCNRERRLGRLCSTCLGLCLTLSSSKKVGNWFESADRHAARCCVPTIKGRTETAPPAVWKQHGPYVYIWKQALLRLARLCFLSLQPYWKFAAPTI